LDSFCKLRPGFYLLGGDEPHAPFQTRDDAERFLELMQAFGEDTEGIKIVEVRSEDIEIRWQLTPPGESRLFRIAESRQNQS
jgi:hypothetical protein